MDINELINQIIYFYKYFKIVDTEYEYLIKNETARNLENADYLENLIKRLNNEVNRKSFMNFVDRKKLDILLIELKNIKTMIFIDKELQKKNKKEKVYN